MISLVQAARPLCGPAPTDSLSLDKTILQQKQCYTMSTTMSPNPSGAAGNGQHYSSSVGWDWFGRFYTEQPEVAGDSMEVYQLRLDFDFVNNLFP